ncbi:hypothetical protein C474_10064 [Halogeometricum pallidum JCM 14848]|uniref:Zn-finger containing protein n=1 Tax=Halogeometricum pallidum JCM 14848 TaxID=1227487 RepID=M0D6R5_HALPD|nr:Sjogren's syndrome/scleroderma autoantigen 1 family protein [Halogeometricum pallidum]ELZ31170.1 hypothetical protein C474_10064 [Halogeometricum pallidum JCM 14848]
MSDFDKEAERQRLREKYEKDAERREETQRMSELLLQGATMTNKHCNQCGTPIFRYQGTEFCPNCQSKQTNAAAETADAAAADIADGEAGSASSDGASGSVEDGESAGEAEPSVPTPEAERDVPAEVSDAGGAPSTEASNAGTGTSNARAGASNGGSASNMRTASTEAAAEESASFGSAESSTAPATGTTEPAGGAAKAADATNATDASMRGAREALLRAITEHARRSTATEEPQQATAHLEAAREAAEALDALDR